jgi:phosphatidate phosphatase APP1
MCIQVIKPSKYSPGPTVDNHVSLSKIQSQSSLLKNWLQKKNLPYIDFLRNWKLNMYDVLSLLTRASNQNHQSSLSHLI